MSWQEKINAALDARRAADALRRRYPVTQGAGRWLVADDRQYLNFSSNDYLGLSHHPQIIRAWQQGAEKFGVGSGGSGHVSGYSVVHQALEEELETLQTLPSVEEQAFRINNETARAAEHLRGACDDVEPLISEDHWRISTYDILFTSL